MAPFPNRNARGGRANAPPQQQSYRQDQSQASRGSRGPAGNAEANGSQSLQPLSESGPVNTPFPSQTSANNSHAVNAPQSSPPRIGSWRPTHHRGSHNNGRAIRGHASQQRVNNRQDVQRSTQTPISNSRADVQQPSAINAPRNASRASAASASQIQADARQNSQHRRANGTRHDAIQTLQNRGPWGPARSPSQPLVSDAANSQYRNGGQDSSTAYSPVGARRGQDTNNDQSDPSQQPQTDRRTEQAVSSLNQPRSSNGPPNGQDSRSQADKGKGRAGDPPSSQGNEQSSSPSADKGKDRTFGPPSSQSRLDSRQSSGSQRSRSPIIVKLSQPFDAQKPPFKTTGPSICTAPHRRNDGAAPPTGHWGQPSWRARGSHQTAIPCQPANRLAVSSLMANAGDRSDTTPHVSPNTAASYAVFGPLLRPGEIPKDGERRIYDWLRASFPSSPPVSQDTSSRHSLPPEPDLALTDPTFELVTSVEESSESKEAPDVNEGTAAADGTQGDWHLHDLEKVHQKALEYQILYKQTPEVAKVQLKRLPEVWKLLNELVRGVSDSSASAANDGMADASNPSATGVDTRSFAFNRGRTARSLQRKIRTVIKELDPYLRHLNTVLAHLVDLRGTVWKLCGLLERAVERRDDPLPQHYRESGLRQEYGTMTPPSGDKSSDLGRYVPLPGEDFGTFDNVFMVKFHSEIAIEERERARSLAQASPTEPFVPDPNGALWDDPPSGPQSWRKSPPTFMLGQSMSIFTGGSSPLVHSDSRGGTGSLSPSVNSEPPSCSPVASSSGLADSRRQSQISDFELDDQFGPEPQRDFRIREHQRLQKVLKRQENLTEETRSTRYPLTCGTKVAKLRVPVKHDHHERWNNLPILLKRYSVTEVTILEFVIALANAVSWWERADLQTKREACDLRDYLVGVMKQLGYSDEVEAEGPGPHLAAVEEEEGLPAQEEEEDLAAREGEQDLAASVTSQGSGSSSLTLDTMEYVNRMTSVYFPNGAHTPPRLESPLLGPQVNPEGEAGVDPFADPGVDRWAQAIEPLIMAQAHSEGPAVQCEG